MTGLTVFALVFAIGVLFGHPFSYLAGIAVGVWLIGADRWERHEIS